MYGCSTLMFYEQLEFVSFNTGPMDVCYTEGREVLVQF